MVTQLKNQETKAKPIPPHLRKLDGQRHKSNGATKAAAAQARADAAQEAEDAAFTEHAGTARMARDGAVAGAKHSSLLARGKDLISGETGSVVTAAAIVVGAALIEVELIPGLIIGAGAILLGKIFPEIGSYVRPAIKGAVRAGFSMTQKAREVMAEASEQVHDLVAEVQHEQNQPEPDKKGHAAKKAGDPSPVH